MLRESTDLRQGGARGSWWGRTLAPALLGACVLCAAALLTAARFSSVPLQAGRFALVGPRCDNIAFIELRDYPAPGPGLPGTTHVTLESTIIRAPALAAAPLTFGSDGTGREFATAGGAPLRVVAGGHILRALGFTFVLP